MWTPQHTLPVAVTVVDGAASAVLRVRPGRRAAVLAREAEAFRVGLVRLGHTPGDAAEFAQSFALAVSHRVEEAGGGSHH